MADMEKWKLIEPMTIHPGPSVVVFSAKLYTEQLYIKQFGDKNMNK